MAENKILKRVLLVNHCGLYWPSGMVRAWQYRPFFERSTSWKAEFTTRRSEFLARLLDGWHIRPLRFAMRPLHRSLESYSRRWDERQEDRIVERAADFDVVCVIKSPATQIYRRLRSLKRPRIMMDINDAVWMPEFQWHDLNALLGEMHGVICENEYIAAYARQYNRRTFMIPDSPQIEVFDRVRGRVQRDPGRIVIGWVGGAGNIGPMRQLVAPLEKLFARHPQLHLRVVGCDEARLSDFARIRHSCRLAFNQKQMVAELLGFDIGLFPLYRNEDGLARGTLKAKVYMSGEAVAVCEDFGENPGLIQDGVNGMLAGSPEQWYEKLEWLVEHPEERAAMARRGLETIRSQFTAAKIFERMTAAYDQVVEGR